jgi:hypothetical protein
LYPECPDMDGPYLDRQRTGIRAERRSAHVKIGCCACRADPGGSFFQGAGCDWRLCHPVSCHSLRLGGGGTGRVRAVLLPPVRGRHARAGRRVRQVEARRVAHQRPAQAPRRRRSSGSSRAACDAGLGATTWGRLAGTRSTRWRRRPGRPTAGRRPHPADLPAWPRPLGRTWQPSPAARRSALAPRSCACGPQMIASHANSRR